MTGTVEKKRRRRGNKNKDSNVESTEKHQSHNLTLIKLDEGSPTWHEYGKDLPGRNDTIFTKPPQPSHQSVNNLFIQYRAMGDVLYQKEIQLVGKNSVRGSDKRWVENTMKKGTLKDRIAATSVTVSNDPVHKFYALDGLLSMAGCSETGGKTNSRVAQLSAEALQDLFINTLLPTNRKLLSLSQRPLYLYETSRGGRGSKKSLSPRILLLWRFEEMVKSKYELFLRKYLSNTLKEGAEMHKIATLQLAAALLVSTPEGESQLLAMVVNKLGDPGKKTAAAAGHQLRMILQKHPNMQVVIAREVQQLAHRPHLSSKALYNCIVFLNQLKLEKEGETKTQKGTETLPASLIKTYFRLFEVAVKNAKKESRGTEGKGMKSRLLSALLAGVNRAHPYLPLKDQDMEEHVDALYRVVHTATPAASTQALMLLFHVAVGSNAAKVNTNETTTELARQDRFYRALYNSLSKPSLVSHGKHLTMFFNLLYKAMKYDSDVNRVNACAKRLMSTSLHANAATIAGSLFLLNEISKTHPTLRTCLADLPDLSNANLILDDTKRDPRSALISAPTIGETMEAESTNREVILCSPFWELALISHHSHPSVSKFASTVGNIVYSGDPLKNFGLAPFLDKFAYRNPKSREKLAGHLKRGKSVAERRSGAESQIQSRLELPVNDPAFLERENVSEQDEFFFKFFVERARRDEVKGITRGTTEEMNDEELEEAEELTLDAAEKAQGLDSVKKFEEYEQAWETDPEEEAFADSLAEKLMESAADGTTDFDDEDPDMSDWSDFDDKKNKDTNDNNEAFNDDSGSFDEDGMAAVERAEAGISDEDDFMDYVSDSESDGSLGDIPTFADAEEHQKLAETDWTESKKTKKRRKT